jgi:hypothetical protein
VDFETIQETVDLIPLPPSPKGEGDNLKIIFILAPLPWERGWGEVKRLSRGWGEVKRLSRVGVR